MRAILMPEPGRVVLVDRPQPRPCGDEVLLEIIFAGICGTDLSSYRGTNPLVSYPRIPGHEISARIVAKGSEVPGHFHTGELVTLCPYSNCGHCTACRSGRPNACRDNQTLGVQRDGAMSQFFTVPWEKLHSSRSLSPEELALTEPLCIGSHAVSRGRITETDIVLVLGCGTIGMGALIAAVNHGAQVIAVDQADAKLAMTREFGAKWTINSLKEPLLDTLLAITNGDGASVVIEAVGAAATYQSALEAAAFCGRVICIGYSRKDILLNTSLIVKKELDVLGSRNAAGEFPGVIAMLEAKKYPYGSLISAVFPLEEAPKAFAAWDKDQGAFMKILIRMS